MRAFLLTITMLLPGLCWAQLFGGNKFESGSYVLSDSRNVRQQGQLKLQSGSKLLVKTADGKTLKFNPEQVVTFRTNSHKYVVARNFHVKGGLGGADVDAGFAEQLDSGQVVLLNYKYSVGAPMSMGAGGGMSYGGASEYNAYLLSRPGDAEATAVQGSFYTGGGKQFRESVRPYLASRPDLVTLLDEKRITSDDLPAVIHALNSNTPFSAQSSAQGAD
ncbi:hypothetical protein [Hymenobacter daeguensis]